MSERYSFDVVVEESLRITVIADSIEEAHAKASEKAAEYMTDIPLGYSIQFACFEGEDDTSNEEEYEEPHHVPNDSMSNY